MSAPVCGMCIAPSEYCLSLTRLDDASLVVWDTLCRTCAADAVGECNLDEPQAASTEPEEEKDDRQC